MRLWLLVDRSPIQNRKCRARSSKYCTEKDKDSYRESCDERQIFGQSPQLVDILILIGRSDNTPWNNPLPMHRPEIIRGKKPTFIMIKIREHRLRISMPGHLHLPIDLLTPNSQLERRDCRRIIFGPVTLAFGLRGG